MKKEKIIRVRITADVAEKLKQVGNVSAYIRSALIAKMENVRKNIDYKKLGYTSPNDYILKTKNVYLNYAERSAVPIELYDDILFQLKHNLYPQLF